LTLTSPRPDAGSCSSLIPGPRGGREAAARAARINILKRGGCHAPEPIPWRLRLPIQVPHRHHGGAMTRYQLTVDNFYGPGIDLLLACKAGHLYLAVAVDSWALRTMIHDRVSTGVDNAWRLQLADLPPVHGLAGGGAHGRELGRLYRCWAPSVGLSLHGTGVSSGFVWGEPYRGTWLAAGVAGRLGQMVRHLMMRRSWSHCERGGGSLSGCCWPSVTCLPTHCISARNLCSYLSTLRSHAVFPSGMATTFHPMWWCP
jgi:hypothetical protein